MILRRFIQHVSEQSWTAIGIDVVVVVVGIFLGLQVTDWNEHRQERLTERHYIQRLLVKTEENIAELEETAQLHQDLQASHLKSITLTLQQELTREERLYLEQHLPRMFFWRSIDLDTGFIDSLLTTGQWRLIRNPVLQDQLVAAKSDSISLQRQLDFFRMWAVQYIVPFTNRSGFRVNLAAFSSVDGSSSAGVEATASAFALAATDQELLSSDMLGMVSSILTLRSNMRGEIEKSLRNAIRLRETLKSELSYK